MLVTAELSLALLRDAFVRVAEASETVGTIDAILFNIAKKVVAKRPEQKQIHGVVLSLYRHCLQMSSEKTTAVEAFGTFISSPWLGLSGLLCHRDVAFLHQARSRSAQDFLPEQEPLLPARFAGIN